MREQKHMLEHIRVDEKILARCVKLMEDLTDGHSPITYIKQEERGLVKYIHDLLYDIRHNVVMLDGAVITKKDDKPEERPDEKHH